MHIIFAKFFFDCHILSILTMSNKNSSINLKCILVDPKLHQGCILKPIPRIFYSSPPSQNHNKDCWIFFHFLRNMTKCHDKIIWRNTTFDYKLLVIQQHVPKKHNITQNLKIFNNSSEVWPRRRNKKNGWLSDMKTHMRLTTTRTGLAWYQMQDCYWNNDSKTGEHAS